MNITLVWKKHLCYYFCIGMSFFTRRILFQRAADQEDMPASMSLFLAAGRSGSGFTFLRPEFQAAFTEGKAVISS